MNHPVTPAEIAELLASLKRLPRLGKPLRERPHLRSVLETFALDLAVHNGAPRSDIERSLKAHLRELLES